MDEGLIGKLSDYQETPYEDQSWEIIDEVDDDPQFIPMDLEMVKTDQEFKLDPMFADYGGRLDGEAEKFYHAPKEESTKSSLDREQELRNEIERLKQEQAQALEAVKEEAFQAGKAEGKQEGILEAVERGNAAMQSVQGVCQDMLAQIKDMIQEIEREAVGFALHVSEKLVGTAVEINPEYLIPIVQEALSNAGSAMIHKVRVSPEDFEFVTIVGLDKMLQEHDSSWSFEADSSVNSGCIVETSAGTIDYQLDEAWKRIADDVMRIAK